MTSLNDSPNTVPPTSSSPPLSSPMVSTKKRVTRTYGSMRVEASPSDDPPDADRSFGTLVDGDVAISLSPTARSPGIDDNAVSSQDTKVDDDDDEEKVDSPKRPKHQWSWMTALKELSESDDEAESAPVPPIPRRPHSVDSSPSPPASRDRSAKSKGKRPAASPKKPRRLPLTTAHLDSRAFARGSGEPETNDSDCDRSPSPLPPKQKRRTFGRTADAAAVGDSESEAPHASSSKPRGGRLDSADKDGNDRTSPGPAKRKRKTITGRKPTAKAIRREEEEIKKGQARIAAERPVEFPIIKQPTPQYNISAFVNSFQARMPLTFQKPQPPNHSSEAEEIQEWSSPVKQVMPSSKRRSAPPPADIDEEIGLEILPPGVEEPLPEPKLAFNRKQSPRKARIPGQRPKDVGAYKRQVNQILLIRHNNKKSEIIQKKESAWKEKGGSTFKPLGDNRAGLGEYLERIESVVQQQQVEEHESDEEYRPSQDQQSPRSMSPSDEDAENNPPLSFISNPESTVESGDDTEEHDENAPPTWNSRAARNVVKRTRISDSDDEEPGANNLRILVPSTSTPDVGEHDTKPPTPIRGGHDRQSLTPADGETDKENIDDNKENAAILSGFRSASSVFVSPRVWKAPSSPTPSRQPQLFERPAPDVRSPLSELRTEDKDEDVFGSPHRRGLSTASDSSFGPPPLSAPLFGAPTGSNDDDNDPQPAPLMRQGFSQLFGTVPGQPLPFDESPKKSPKKGGFSAFRKGDDEFGLSLSLDAKLQPALEVSSTALRRADDIFQNEQEMIMQAAQETTGPKKPQLYIDENGFLTQSLPAGTNPQVYCPATQVTPLTARKPLGTLAIADTPLIFSDHDEPGSPSPSKPARRLRRRDSDSSAPGGGAENGSPLPLLLPKRNAFKILAVGAQKVKEREPLKRSEFVEAEAQESDEDDGFGFKKKTGDDEGDSDTDDDKPVEGLVDDTVMDGTALAEKLVQEKYKEHQEQDDAQLEKQARDIIEGKKRVKRRGIDLGSDDSGSEDEDADRRRRKSIKKPRFDDGKLEGISGDVDPTAFLRAYNSNLEDTEPLFPVDEDSQMVERDDDEDDDDNAEPRETISTREIEAQVRKAVREKKYDEVDSFDPSDVRFTGRDSDDDGPPLRTREVAKRSPKVKRMRDSVDTMCFQSYLDESQRSQEQSWVKNLGSSNITGFYQGPSGGAVTAAGARAKGKLSRTVTKPSNPREERRKPAKDPSMLASALKKGKAC